MIWQMHAQNAAAPGRPPIADDIRTLIVQPNRSAKSTASLVASLAGRCANAASGTIPRDVHEQHWSAINMPMIWHASGSNEASPVAQWLVNAAAGAPHVDIGLRPPLEASVSVQEGLTALRRCMRAWGVTSRNDLCRHLQDLGFHGVQPGQYLSRAAQEAILDQAIAADVNVALLDAAYVIVTLHLAQQPGLVAELSANLEMRQGGRNPAPTAEAPPAAAPSGSQTTATHQHPAWVRINNIDDLNRCIGAARLLRPHLPTHASTEMSRAGVGEQPPPAACTDGPAQEHPLAGHSRRERRAGTDPATVAVLTEAMRATEDSTGGGRQGRRRDDRLPAEPPSGAWECLDRVDLLEEFRRRRNILRSCPGFMRGRYRHAQRIALEAINRAVQAEDIVAEERAWKLFGLLSAMLLHRTTSQGSVGKAELEHRCDLFSRGAWDILLASANVPVAHCPHQNAGDERRRKRESAQRKVRLEELSKARQALTGGALAPGTPETLAELKDETKRPIRLTADLPAAALEYRPDRPIGITFKLFVRTLKAAARGASGGPGGCTNEHLKVALDDEDTAALLHAAALRLASAKLPPAAAAAFMTARMTALLKSNGRVRGIATGTAFRRLVASCIARVIGPEVDRACRPFQYALTTRAGTECVGHLFRAACDLDPELCILSIDGVGAFDHIRRAAMLGKLVTLPTARDALPFVRLSYETRTEYVWADEKGDQEIIPQGEGGEQGDPLMPLLFALGIHDALQDVASRLQPGEDLAAFLDDVYVLCKPDRVRDIYNMLEEAFGRIAGIQLHTGKTRVWNKSGITPRNIEDLGGEGGAWSPDGVVLLGVPVGTPDFVRAHAQERLEEEKRFLAEIEELTDPQCAWQLLTRCAVPRGNYWIRTLPPSLSRSYALERDDALWRTCISILRAQDLPEHHFASGRRIAQLPARMGGLGIRSTLRSAPAAYWASWADAIEMIQARNPSQAANILERLTAGTSEGDGCLHEAAQSADALRHDGFDNLPSWQALSDGLRPPPLPQTHDPIDRTPGWQYFASSSREKTERTEVLKSMCRSARALLRSQAGPGASAALDAAPTSRSTTLEPEHFQAMIRRRLRWPLPLAAYRCACGGKVDELGDHFSACMKSGRVKSRAPAIERTVAQMCREAGARVQSNVKLRDLNIAVRASDLREIEVIASGLPIFGGAQLAVDVTLRCVLGRDGQPRPQSDWKDGALTDAARRDKEQKYHELTSGSRCRLVVLALETGGRFSPETVEFIRQLADAKALGVPEYLRAPTAAAYQRRWTRMLAVSLASSYANSLLRTAEDVGCGGAGVCREPWLQDLLTESRSDTFWSAGASGA